MLPTPELVRQVIEDKGGDVTKPWLMKALGLPAYWIEELTVRVPGLTLRTIPADGPGRPREIYHLLKPFTVVKDWDSDMFEESCDSIRVSEDPEIFHVWADSGSDASDEAERLAEKKFGAEAAYYLHAVAVLKGHAEFAED
ncbi:hypothetical protein [Streptomyces ardesiacus]|uniref:hypothetical protein n=1 Tax=Streptomyces ardesiacus TaxID=285564 RepID=UPI0038152F74